MISEEARTMRVEDLPFYLIHIRNISLTLAGIVELSCFPEAAIKYADDSLAGKSITSPFEFMCGAAGNYCKNKKLKVDYQRRKELRIAFKIQDGAPKMYFDKPLKIEEVKGKKRPFHVFEDDKFEGREGKDRSYWEENNGKKTRHIDPERQLDPVEEYHKFEKAKQESEELRASIKKLRLREDFNPFRDGDDVSVLFKGKK